MLTGTYMPYVSGGGENNVRFASYKLAEQGHEVFIITTEPYIRGVTSLAPNIEFDGSIKVYRFYPANLYHFSNVKEKNILGQSLWCIIDAVNLHAFYEVKKILEREKPDVVHVHNFRGISILSSTAIKSLKIPWIYTINSVNLICPRGSMSKKNGTICTKERLPCKVYSKINKSVLGSPDVVISPSKFIQNEFIKRGFFKDSKHYILPNPNRLVPKNVKPKFYDSIDILYVGTMVRSKGIYILLDAYKRLKRKDVNLHFVGKGLEYENLKNCVRNLKNVYIYGYLNGQDLLDMYCKANITVVPSTCHDNLPSVIIESFGCGTPVVGSKIGGIPELVDDGINGKMFEAGDAPALKNLLDYLIDNPTELKKMEAGALKSAEKYIPKNHFKKLIEIYQSAVYNESKQQRTLEWTMESEKEQE
jgi:glycosyltransferase involved in cell wall biosynthesis